MNKKILATVVAVFVVCFAVAAQEPGGKWYVEEPEIDALTDTVNFKIGLHSEEARRSSGHVQMQISCSQYTDGSTLLFVMIYWGEILDHGRIDFRLGDEEHSTASWSTQAGSESTFHREPVAFVKSLMEADSFMARAHPWLKGAITVNFDVRGLSDVIQPLRDACEW